MFGKSSRMTNVFLYSWETLSNVIKHQNETTSPLNHKIKRTQLKQSI